MSNIKDLFGIGKMKVSDDISKNFRKIDESGRKDIIRTLRNNYFTREIWGEAVVSTDNYLETQEGKMDLDDHLNNRLVEFRRTVIPWINDAAPLSGLRILEIGCGTGSSTVALSEQGADVTAVDIDEPSLIVARDRCAAYGLDAVIQKGNATEVHKTFQDRSFDLVIYFASIEHMTHKERISAMKSTWDMLPDGALWCILDTPNRLWFFDGHTAQLPFFHWLPDEFAFEYSKFSARAPFNTSFREMNDDTFLTFLRHGRGVSYHEFQMSMKRVEELDVVSCLQDQNPLRTLIRKLVRTTNYRYERLLTEVGPKIHRGFYQPSLNLIIRKG
jgi:2-polyprenyl-3-methyl-5-hydroxy-6-metoxy-1,4-benzoquinol methylase